MEEDKALKKMLDKWGVEETSEGFTLKTMQAIQGLHPQQHGIQPIKNLRGLFYLFCLVGLAALGVAALLMQPVSIPNEINVVLGQLNNRTTFNLLSFIFSLWILLFVNRWYEKRNYGKGQADQYARHF